MTQVEDRSFLSSLRRKIIAAFLLIFSALGLAFATTYFGFHELLGTVEELSAPREKLNMLNRLFEDVTRLDQQQRADAIQHPEKSYRAFLHESKVLVDAIDSLEKLSWENEQQPQRLESMKKILNRRDQLLIQYLRFKSDASSKNKFSNQLDSLSQRLILSVTPRNDSSVTTTEKKTITTTYVPAKEEKKSSLLTRIFGGKKKQENLPQVKIQEETKIRIDTLAIAQQDSSLARVGGLVRSFDKNQKTQAQQILQREFQLVTTNIVLINQLLSILQEVENEEISSMQAKNNDASLLVNSSLNRMTVITIIFLLMSAVLAFLILIDVSKSNFYRKNLIKAKEEAERLSHVKQRFLANMSHEIRTPLQSIIGFSEQLPATADTREAVGAIRASSEHLLHVVNEVLDVSRIGSDTFSLNHVPFHIHHVVEEVAAVIRIHAEKKGLLFTVVVPDKPEVLVLGDPFRLKQILYNLLGNAVKFTQRGFVRITTEISLNDRITCVFAVADSGIGMTDEETGRIFDQFEQGNQYIQEHYGGTGLGLAIAKKLVDIQKGTIDVLSVPGSGTTFTVMLSFDPAPDEIKMETRAREITSVGHRGKVLVVDDDNFIIRLCSMILENHGIAYRVFQEPKPVLEEGVSDIDFIFLDIRMPGMNGIELCREIRKQNSRVKIIAITAHVLAEDDAILLQNGFDHVLHKPFREQEFLAVMEMGTDSHMTQANHAHRHDNFANLRAMTLGDEALFQTVLLQFETETKSNLADLARYLTDQNVSALREIIHKLSGRTGQLGATTLARELYILESQLEKGQSLSELNPGILRAEASVNKLLDEVQSERSVFS